MCQLVPVSLTKGMWLLSVSPSERGVASVPVGPSEGVAPVPVSQLKEMCLLYLSVPVFVCSINGGVSFVPVSPSE